MPDRGQFWSAVPDWSQAGLHTAGIDIGLVGVASVCLVSGDARQFLARHGVGEILGPRQPGNGDTYALRLAPDRMLFVGDASAIAASAGITNGCAVTDVSDGIVIFDILGDRAADLMAQGSEYPFDDTTIYPHESASMQFAGLRVIVSHRERGWRLHAERPWAPALWRWLQAHIE
jgi:heterotetrameric sarcosine oxidase gamma subunit